MSIESGEISHLFSRIGVYEGSDSAYSGVRVSHNPWASRHDVEDEDDAESSRTSSSMMRMHLTMVFVSLAMTLALIILAMVNNASVHPRKGWRQTRWSEPFE